MSSGYFDKSLSSRTSTSQAIAAAVRFGASFSDLAVIVAFVNGVFDNPAHSDVLRPPTATASKPSCPGVPVDVQVPSAPGPQAVVTITELCRPEPGHDYLWVIEADGIQPGNHMEFYPKTLPEAPIGQGISLHINLNNDSIGEQNCVYVLEPSDSQYEQLLGSLNANNFVSTLPDEITRVSAPHCERRSY